MRPGVVLTVLVCDACLTTNAARVSFHDSSTGLTRRWNVRSDPPPTCVVGILARPPIEWRLVPMVGCLVARCEPLGLTACAKTAGALSEAINRELVDLFLALEREGRLDAYAAERGWTVVRHASGEPIELDVPWRLVREP
ncbi:MAG: hypothetical protein JNL21_35120 [Myxococcales bacterium]|nr:hypothetical protein [Myxococcales bacterium]